MNAPQPSAPEVSDDQLVRQFSRITVGFAAPLVLVLVLGVTVLIPGGSVRTVGAAIGAGLALWSWIASRWMTGHMAATAARTRSSLLQTGRPEDAQSAGAAGAVRVIAFVGIGMAGAPALIGLPLAQSLGGDIGPFVVAIPVAVVALIVNASGPPAIRRHLAVVRG